MLVCTRALENSCRPARAAFAILANASSFHLSNAARDLNRGKRRSHLERSLEDCIENSSCRLDAWLGAEGSSPSLRATRNEQLLSLSDALAGLPEPQREALLLKHCQELTLKQIAEKMGRTIPAVASLLRRGLEALRCELKDEG